MYEWPVIQPTSAEHQYTSSSGLRSKTYFVVHADAGQVAAGRVQHALRLVRRARRVEDEQRVLGVELLGRALVVGLLHRLVEPDVAVAHRHVVDAGVLDDERRLDVDAALVDLLLDRRGLALAPRAVDG